MIKQLTILIATIVNLMAPKPSVKAPAIRYPSPGMTHEVIEATKRWTVLINGEGWDGWNRGTGVLIDPTHVLTCHHVAAMNMDTIWVHFYPGYFEAKGKMVYSDRSKDLAILELDVPVWATQYARFTTDHYDGEPIMVIGNAEGSMKWFVSYGIVSGENSRDLFTDGQVYAGDSGGPWINNKGNIVALTSWGWEFDDKVQVNGGIASHTIYDFLLGYKKFVEKK